MQKTPAWKLVEEAERVWGERLAKTEPALFFVCDVVGKGKAVLVVGGGVPTRTRREGMDDEVRAGG